MAGRRGKNLREGDLAEGIGLELLRSFTAVAPVPRTEDTGVDAVCTLLRPSGRFLLAEDSFLVQIKAASVRTLEFIDDDYTWLLQLKLPIFLASVNLKDAVVDFHTLQRAVDRVDDQWRGVSAYLDSLTVDDGDDYDHGPNVHDGIHQIYLGPPVLRWSAVEAATEEFRQRAYTVTKQWVAWEETNLKMRPYKCCNVPSWRTNEGPEWSHSRYDSVLTPGLMQDFGSRFGATMIALVQDCTTTEATAILRFIEFLRSRRIRANEIEAVELMLQRRLAQ